MKPKIKELFAWMKTEKVVPIDVFLKRVGIDMEASAAFAAYRYFGSLDKMLVWAQPGGFHTPPKLHDLDKPSLIKLREGLREHTDLIEALTEYGRVVGSQKEYVAERWSKLHG